MKDLEDYYSLWDDTVRRCFNSACFGASLSINANKTSTIKKFIHRTYIDRDQVLYVVQTYFVNIEDVSTRLIIEFFRNFCHNGEGVLVSRK